MEIINFISKRSFTLTILDFHTVNFRLHLLAKYLLKRRSSQKRSSTSKMSKKDTNQLIFTDPGVKFGVVFNKYDNMTTTQTNVHPVPGGHIKLVAMETGLTTTLQQVYMGLRDRRVVLFQVEDSWPTALHHNLTSSFKTLTGNTNSQSRGSF